MQPWIQLDSLHVVSDLHLGGGAGFQIFDSAAELEWLIDHVAALPSPGTHGLLINGDFIDFLAEEPSAAFDPEGAVVKLDRVWQCFPGVFAAMQRLLAKPSRRLIVNLGNHDVELALPWVRAHLAARLTGGDDTAHARLLLVTDGTGVQVRVGNARVVCVHGNEVDSWNVIDYERLRRVGRDHQFGLRPEAWVPNAGSQLVVEVMNAIKRDYPFVDLLKPETQGVIPLLLALDTGVQRKLLNLSSVGSRLAWDAARLGTGFLGDEDAGAAARPPAPVMVFPALPPGQRSRRLSDEVESVWQNKEVSPISLVRATQGQQLGLGGAFIDWITGKPRSEVVREALEQLDQDRSFKFDAEDQTFRDLDALLGADVDLVVAGHTHLARSLPRKQGGGHYFNSGTWARLMQLTPTLRKDPVAFEKLFSLLRGSMETLDQARIAVAGEAVPVEVIRRLNTVVLIEHTPSDGTRASLQQVRPAADGVPIRLEPAPDAASWPKQG